MRDAPFRTWSTDALIHSAFAVPRGFRGWLAGRCMRLVHDPSDLFALLDVRPGAHVLEVGYGPGRLVRMLTKRTEAAKIYGVDPSPEMCADAAAYNAASVASGRVDLRLGTADATGFDAGQFDLIVSVHNVAIWPSLEAGLDELCRVLRPEGTLVIAWHGGRARTMIARNLRLPQDKLELLSSALGERFERVEQIDQDRDVVFRASGRRGPG
jgi:SAM-dependent methyltransferase